MRRDRGAGGDDERPPQLFDAGDVGERFVEELVNGSRVHGEPQPGLGGGHAAGGAQEQRRADRVLEPSNLRGHRGLRQVESLGGGRNPPRVEHGQEGREQGGIERERAHGHQRS